MSIVRKFGTLLQDLDSQSLEELLRSIGEEIAAREGAAAPRLENIRPGMSQAERDLAANEIARLLRER